VTGALGQSLSALTVAKAPNDTSTPYNRQILILDDDLNFAITKVINDACPACETNTRQFDNYTPTVDRCSLVPDFGTGYYQTILLP
jgi:hypothetical protein